MKHWAFALALLAGAPTTAATTMTGDLPRRADIGFRAEASGGDLKIGRLVGTSSAAGAGLRDGDKIRAVGGRRFERGYEGLAMLQRLKGGRPVELVIERDGREVKVSFTPPAAPLEDFPSRDTEYGMFQTSDGVRLRTIVSRPANAAGPVPAIFFTQWVSCGTIEDKGPAGQQLRSLAERAGVALIRVERAGAGDSEGPACHRLDYDTEVRHYREALDALARHPWIAGDRIVVYGSSLGATVAPLVAQGRKVAGVLAQGGGALTYAERMINFDRFYLERTGVAPGEIDRRMRDYIAFQAEYLLRGWRPEQIARERPELAGVWAMIRGSGDGVHYGRPYAYHQQAAKKDFLAAWASIDAPVMVVYGGLDQFETRHGHELIVRTLDRLRPGSATFLEIPNADHDLDVYPSAEDAYAYRGGQTAPELFVAPAATWVRRVVGMPER